MGAAALPAGAAVALADPVVAGVVQLLARFAVFLEVPIPECVTIRIAIPAPRTHAMRTAITASRARGRSWNPP
ncbi:MAG TPA: hypothetical protein DEH11_08835 [Actinobacteria bacterium]|nr:hypothetical protein [Actinomycetota bacterium]